MQKSKEVSDSLHNSYVFQSKQFLNFVNDESVQKSSILHTWL